MNAPFRVSSEELARYQGEAKGLAERAEVLYRDAHDLRLHVCALVEDPRIATPGNLHQVLELGEALCFRLRELNKEIARVHRRALTDPNR